MCIKLHCSILLQNRLLVEVKLNFILYVFNIAPCSKQSLIWLSIIRFNGAKSDVGLEFPVMKVMEFQVLQQCLGTGGAY